MDATTWKYGLVWSPLDWLRFRGTQSRDIRAPNVSELFGPVTSGFGILNDPARGGAQTNPTVRSGSNAALLPEKADTRTAGIVITPKADSWVGRIQFSADYYKIDIEEAIGTLGAQTIATRCFEGATEFCGLITRDGNNVITNIVDVQQNVNQLNASGLDIELSYRHPTERFGEFSFRLLDTHVYHLVTVDSAGPLDRAGQTGLRGGTIPGIPRYTLDALVDWKTGPLGVSLHGRYVPSGIYNAAFIGPEQRGYDIALANSSIYGLSGSIWTNDVGQALRTARALESGTLSVNSNSSIRIQTPYGGFKQSGIGRGLGQAAIEAYTELKTVFVRTEP